MLKLSAVGGPVKRRCQKPSRVLWTRVQGPSIAVGSQCLRVGLPFVSTGRYAVSRGIEGRFRGCDRRLQTREGAPISTIRADLAPDSRARASFDPQDLACL